MNLVNDNSDIRHKTLFIKDLDLNINIDNKSQMNDLQSCDTDRKNKNLEEIRIQNLNILNNQNNKLD
jgi:hypothetical protein